MASKGTATMIRALSDDTRLKAFEILVEGDSSLSRLSEKIEVGKNDLIEQMSILVDSGLVNESGDDDDRDYFVDPQQVAILTGFFELMLNKCSPPKCC
jgi:predicted transcriptional regulator